MRALLVVVLGLLLITSFPAGSAAGKDKEKLVVTPGEKKDDVEILNCAPKGRALFLAAPGAEAGKKTGLLVALHGHGGNPEGYVFRDFAAKRKWAVVSIEGRTDTPNGGHTWDLAADPPYVDAVTKWCVQNRGIDPTQVVVFGHSMGGTMSLASYVTEPTLFAGIITCSSPEIPDKREDATRVVVFLGTADPNFSQAKGVQTQMKKDANRLSLGVVDTAEHNDTPAAPYLDLAVDWILAKNALGHEFHIPKKPPDEPAAGFRHILVRYKGAAGAPAELKRSKEAAKAAADDLLKRVRAGKALFSAEAQASSEDETSQPLGGAIDAERLAGFGGALAGIKDAAPGADRWSGPFESPAGWHVVERTK
jgi:poly(3-hydroxybutyrate) depolymerase